MIKHGPGNNFVNSGTSYLLEKEIKQQIGIQANTQRLDHLSSLYDEADLMKALGLAVAAFRERPMSHDGFLGFVESLLLEAEKSRGRLTEKQKQQRQEFVSGTIDLTFGKRFIQRNSSSC